MIKRIIATILTFSLMVMMSPTLQSQAFSSDNTMTDSVEALLSEYDKSIQIGNPKSLYDDEEKVIALGIC